MAKRTFQVIIKTPDPQKMVEQIRRTFASRETVAAINNEVIPEIKDFIKTGVSPVRGKRRFEGYKDPKKYPAKKKAARPVNLELTGETLNAYAAEIDDKKIALGIKGSASEFAKNKANWNNAGTERIPARRIIPLTGEQYAVTVMRKLVDIFSKRIQTLFKKP